MPVVTQTRQTDVRKLASTLTYRDRSGKITAIRPGEDTTLSSYQTTTSYRSGVGTKYDVDNLSGKELRKEVLHEATRNSRFDTGNEFLTEKWGVRLSHEDTHLHVPISPASSLDLSYDGPIFLNAPYGSVPDIPSLDTGDLGRFGQSLVVGLAPTAPSAGLTQFVGELREGLPRLVGLQAAKSNALLRGIGKEHLNFQFGLRPFVSDIQKMAASVLKANALIRQYLRDSDRVVRRRRQMPTKVDARVLLESSSANVLLAYIPTVGNPTSNFYGNNGNCKVSVTERTTLNRWFSCAYTYHVSGGADLSAKLERYDQLANKLLGTRFTTETAWELTPWSWLIDWNLDIGTNIRAAERFSSDQLVLRYGYVMEHVLCERTIVASGLVSPQGTPMPSVTATYFRERKARKRATPFGFDVDLGKLSPSQWSILGALGMTKAPGALRTKSTRFL